MHEQQPNPRITATRAFMESLDQLQNILAQERQIAESGSHRLGDSVSDTISPESAQLPSTEEEGCCANGWSVSKILEEAAADLDEFFGDAQLSREGELSEES